MSMYGDSDYANQKNNLYDEICDFLDDGHPISELLDIVSDAVEYKEDTN